MVTPENNLRRLFAALQDELLAGLKANKVIDHPGAKGAATEADWLKVLQQHLPQRYSADRAIVIDAHGDVSDYLDIVIYDRQYSPVIFARNREQYIPAESVLATFEVKQTLNAANVKYAGDKIASVRRLHRTSADVHTLEGVKPGRKPCYVTGGILTTTADWQPAFGDAYLKALGELDANQRIDLGCSLAHGAFRASYDKGLATEQSTDASSLVSFFMWLLMDLQPKANAPAIDWNEYIKALEP